MHAKIVKKQLQRMLARVRNWGGGGPAGPMTTGVGQVTFVTAAIKTEGHWQVRFAGDIKMIELGPETRRRDDGRVGGERYLATDI